MEAHPHSVQVCLMPAAFRHGDHVVVCLPWTDGYQRQKDMKVLLPPDEAKRLAEEIIKVAGGGDEPSGNHVGQDGIGSPDKD